MKLSPYRKGVPESVSNAAILAAASMIAQAYRGGTTGAGARILNLAAEIIDEIEIRRADAMGDVKRAVASVRQEASSDPI